MQLPIILASDEQNVKPYPKKTHDACSTAWRRRSLTGQKAEHICGGIFNN
ncbi:MAG: hypothetical protein ACJ71R_12320 [Nitrososphaeraceae archaeon]